MSQKQPTRSKNHNKIKKQVYAGTPEVVVEAIAIQLDRAQDAARRIVEEGSVVRDLRGAVLEHPAIDIERKAMKIYTDLFAKWYEN